METKYQFVYKHVKINLIKILEINSKLVIKCFLLQRFRHFFCIMEGTVKKREILYGIHVGM